MKRIRYLYKDTLEQKLIRHTTYETHERKTNFMKMNIFNSKRFLSLFLAFVMVIGMLPMTVFAVVSGDGWYISDNGTLVVTGKLTSLPQYGYFSISVTSEGELAFADNEVCKYEVINAGTISGGTFQDEVRNSGGTISGGIFQDVVNTLGIISGGTFQRTVENDGRISGGTFQNTVKNDGTGTISGGVFNGVGAVNNLGIISGGTFSNTVENYGTISNGTFIHFVTNNNRITGGTFDGAVTNNRYISGGTFENGVLNNDYGQITGGTFSFVTTNNGVISNAKFLMNWFTGNDPNSVIHNVNGEDKALAYGKNLLDELGKAQEGTAWYAGETCVNGGTVPLSYTEYTLKAHSHNYVYTGSANLITETCTNGCGHSKTATLQFKSGADFTYTGSAIEPMEIVYSEGWAGSQDAVVAYENNINVGTATAKATIEGKEISTTFQITVADIKGATVTLNPESGTYDGNENKPSVSVVLNGKTLVESTDYTIEWDKDGFTDADTYTATVTGKDNYTGEKTATFSINPAELDEANTEVTLDKDTFVYDGTEHKPNVTVTYNGAPLTQGVDYKVTYQQARRVENWKPTQWFENGETSVECIDASDNYYVVVEGMGNYYTEDQFTLYVPFKIEKREIEIEWTNTEFIYDSYEKIPTATVKNLVTGDTCNITVSGAQTDAGTGYIATAVSVDNNNYKLPSDDTITTTFTIDNASQDAPDVGGTDETIKGKADGKISNLTTAMEISTDNTTYNAVTEADITKDYAAGTYYVRYAAKKNYDASKPTTVVIGDGETLIVTVPITQTGYTLRTDDAELEWKGGTTLTFTLADGYSKTDDFAVKVNGNPVTLTDNQYVISNAQEDITVTVDGVADITAPEVEMSVKGVGWKKFFNKVTFGLFFKENVEVKVEASDLGSKIKTAEYLITETAFTTEDAVKADTSVWTALTLDENDVAKFSVTEKGKKYVYVRVTDNDGNITVVNSDGGVVVYTDSTADTTAISFIKTTTDDITAKVNLNGNTVKAIYNGTDLIDSRNYSVAADGTITFKATYLDTLADGTYTLHIVYNPQGETYVESETNDAPAQTKITLNVGKQTGTVSITNDISKTYDGTAVTAPTYDRNNANGTVVVEYKKKGADDSTYSTDAPKKTGDYTVRVTVKADDAGFYTEAVSVPVDFTISKATLTVTVDNATATYGDDVPSFSVQYSGFVTNEDEKILGGALAFDCDYVQFSDKGEYTIKASGYTSDNYEIEYVDGKLTVSPKPITVTIQSATSVYGDEIAELKATDNGIVNNDKNVYSLATTATSTSNVGKYAITGTAQNDNYTITFANEADAYEITKRELTVSVVVADKKYDGLNNATITSAKLNNVANNDKIDLSNGTATFASVDVADGISINFTPFSISGDKVGNYTLTQPTDITANITNGWYPALNTEYTTNGSDWMNTDFIITAKEGYLLSLTNTANGTWADSLTGNVEGADSSVKFYVKNITDGTISEMATANYKLDKNTEATKTTGKVEFVERTVWQEFVSTITFGLFYNSEVTVKVSADDALSGIANIEYTSSDKAMTLDEVKAITAWTEYTDSFGVTLEDAKKFVYFVRITDNAGNVTYLSSDGAEYDTTAPVISGVENGGVYYTTQKVTVSDKNIGTITLNGEPVSQDFTLTGNTDATYTIVAVDRAENKTTITVTMKTIASIDDTIDGIAEDDVKSSDEEKVEDVAEQVEELLKDEDLTDEEKAALEEIKTNTDKLFDKIEETGKADETENTEKVKDITSDTVTPEDKTDLEKAKDDLEKTLEDYADNLTDEEKQAIQDEIDRVDEALDVVEKVETVEDKINALPDTITKDDEDVIKAAEDAYNALTDYEKSLVDKDAKQKLDDAKAALAELSKPADSTSPATGDNSNMFLWIALLFISGGAVITLSVVDRKKRAVRK